MQQFRNNGGSGAHINGHTAEIGASRGETPEPGTVTAGGAPPNGPPPPPAALAAETQLHLLNALSALKRQVDALEAAQKASLAAVMPAHAATPTPTPVPVAAKPRKPQPVLPYGPEDLQRDVLALLVEHGHRTMSDLYAALGPKMPEKSEGALRTAMHRAVERLDKQGMCRVTLGKLTGDRRGPHIVYHRNAIALDGES